METRMEGRPNRLQNLLTTIGGAYNQELSKFPEERTKFAIIGLFVVNTAFLSFLTMNFALHALYPNTKETKDWVLIGLVSLAWAFIIFTIDWGLIKTMSKEPYTTFSRWLRVTFIPTLLRIVVASLISFTISKPFEVRVAGKKLIPFIGANRDAFVRQQQTERDSRIENKFKDLPNEIKRNNELKDKLEKGPVSEEYKTQKSKLKSLQNQKTTNDALLIRLADELKKNYIKNCIRRDSVGKCIKSERKLTPRGYQIVAQQKSILADNNRLQKDIDTIVPTIETMEKDHKDLNLPLVKATRETAEKNLREQQLEKNQAAIRDSLMRMKADTAFDQSLLNQIEALETMADSDKTGAMFWTKWLIFFVILLVDLMPIFIKLLSDYGNYDRRMAELRQERDLTNRQDRFASREMYKANRSLIRKAVKSMKEINKESINKWEQEEIQKARRRQSHPMNEPDDNED